MAGGTSRCLLLATFLSTCVFQEVFNDFVAENCPDGWVRFRDSCYFFGDEQAMDFTEARHFCSQHSGADLVVVETAEENILLSSYAKRLFKPCTKGSIFWMGGSDEEVEGMWVWLRDHVSLGSGYTNWHPGEPYHGAANEDCLCLAQPLYDWHDCLCNEKWHPLCEKNLTMSRETEIIG